MKRTIFIAVLGVAVIVGAFFYVKSTQDPPIPKVEMATPANTHGRTPMGVQGAG